MPKAFRTLFAALTFLTLAAGCDRGDHPGLIGSPAPQFTLADGSRSVDLAKLRGHVVIVNFWATWCLPCVDELPSLLALQRQMPNVDIVAISQDEDPVVYKNFLDQYHVDLLSLRDPSGRIPALYGTAKIPESYIIDRTGVVRRKFVSSQKWTSSEIVDYINKL
ncbi:Peroxiredoxin [Granulicella rosea]|uniref:Peroxiredoxin n=1 Tax=Granulicella rosea TaxID=474952 RepID=A0A239IX99_9BACT|nr:TlpA disulfide reductase family protein [Granulicella rosea]SNS98022.1 Peroxiredoxin [Granulicella rosea]